ncbi:hypothetical protein PBI_SCTP2_275 [Salicola phage SCTP-2]|nr:hypothetical protein PBI_SCTP2_275 [Salicola phage SCTP-2]
MSELLKQIKKDQLQARKNKETEKSKVLTTLLGTASPSGNDTVTDKDVIAVVQKFIKSANETMQYQSNSDYDITDIVNEVRILEQYLPKQLSIEEMKRIAEQYINDNEITSPKQMGRVMSYFNENYSGQYDGKELSAIVKQLLI